jgi:hypothetical protein
MEPDHCELALSRIGDFMPGLITPGLSSQWRPGSGNVFHTFVIRAACVANVANLGNFSPTHIRVLKMQVNDELTYLRGKRL